MIELLDTPDEITALLPAWCALEARATAPLLFQTPDWVLPWFTAFATPETARVAVLREGDAVRALAPCTLTTQKLGPFPAHTLALVHNAHSARNDILYAGGDVDAAVTLTLGLRTAGPWALLELRDLPEASPTVAALQEHIATQRVHAEWLPSDMRTPILECHGTWEEYHESRSRNFRRNIRRAWEKLEARGAVDLVQCQSPEEIREGVRTVAELERMGWKGEAGTTLDSDAKLLEFYTDVALRFAARGALDLSVMQIDATPVAACYALRHASVVYGLKVSFNPAFADASPGLMLALRMFERQWTPETRAFDMLEVSGFPSDRLTDRFDARLRVRLFGGGLYARMLGTLKRGVARRPVPVDTEAP